MEKSVIIIEDLNISSLFLAASKLKVALASPKSDLQRDASIQRFEYTFELAWKTLKRILRYRGTIANSPRETFRMAAKEGLISDPGNWFIFLENRNATSHIYNEDIADSIYNNIPNFMQEVSSLLETIRKL